MTRLTTDWTWDGRAITECATLTLSISNGALSIAVRAPFYGDTPPSAAIGPTWELWNHEAVELFVCSAENPPQYTEIELGPHGHHLVLRLVGIRNIVERELPLHYRAEIHGKHWVGQASVPLSMLPAQSAAGWRINATHVWGPPAARNHTTAARLSAATPDFHRPDEFGHGYFPE